MHLVIDSASVGKQLVAFEDALHLQRQIHQGVVAKEFPDTIVLLEHENVYTAGRRTEDFERPTDGTSVIDVDRGGKITWHGQGQLVGYPIVHLTNPMDVVSHVRKLEDVLIGVCQDFDLQTNRIKGRSGVWVCDGTIDRKLAAIGVRVAQGVTMHGFALNCNNDLSWFDRIVPCGISDAEVTTLSKELGLTIKTTDILPSLETHLRRVFTPTVDLKP